MTRASAIALIPVISRPKSVRLLPLRLMLVRETLSLINAAITTADAGPRRFPEKLSELTGMVPLSSLIGRAKPSRLTYTQCSMQSNVGG